jgi:hypothetical protein
MEKKPNIQGNNPPHFPEDQRSPKNVQPENMDVHHHAHHHGKKKWTDYMFEFFMLFLAVFCGFLAEYQLEHIIEHKRETQYIRSMIEDLRTDTAKLNSNISRYDKMKLKHDTMLLSIGSLKQGFNGWFYKNLNVIKGYPDFIYTDGTIQQLKNAGGLRLIRKTNVVDSIMSYDATVKVALLNEENLGHTLEDLEKTQYHLLNFSGLHNELRSGKTPEQVEQQKLKFILLGDTELAQFYNEVDHFSWLCAIVRTNMDNVRQRALRLIYYLQHVYDLEE